MPARSTFFSTETEDAALEERNLTFWQSLVNQIDADYNNNPQVSTLIDVGSHRAGFLSRASSYWHCDHVFGIEPIQYAREQSIKRLEALGVPATILSPERWNTVPSGVGDLLIGQEMLYLVKDLSSLLKQAFRVLKRRRRAYFTLGCHTENPLWPSWKKALSDASIVTYDYSPLEIMQIAEDTGFHVSVRPLRRDGWIIHSFEGTTYPTPSVSSLCEHHYRQKLLFRFEKR